MNEHHDERNPCVAQQLPCGHDAHAPQAACALQRLQHLEGEVRQDLGSVGKVWRRGWGVWEVFVCADRWVKVWDSCSNEMQKQRHLPNATLSPTHLVSYLQRRHQHRQLEELIRSVSQPKVDGRGADCIQHYRSAGQDCQADQVKQAAPACMGQEGVARGCTASRSRGDPGLHDSVHTLAPANGAAVQRSTTHLITVQRSASQYSRSKAAFDKMQHSTAPLSTHS